MVTSISKVVFLSCHYSLQSNGSCALYPEWRLVTITIRRVTQNINEGEHAPQNLPTPIEIKTLQQTMTRQILCPSPNYKGDERSKQKIKKINRPVTDLRQRSRRESLNKTW